MSTFIIENIVNIVATLVLMLIGVLGAWLTSKIGQRTELTNVNAAMHEVIKLAQQTVEELQQTTVDDLKAASTDGKLTEVEIKSLGVSLLNKTKKKMSAPTEQVLTAAGVDITALIKGAAEAWINTLKTESL